MAGSSIATRYARALFRQCSSLSAAEAMQQKLVGLSELFEVPSAQRVLNSAVMPNDLKLDLLLYAVKTKGADAELASLMKVIVEAGRTTVIPKIVEAFQELIATASGRSAAIVETAVKLPAQELEQVRNDLSKALSQKIDLAEKVLPELLGGFRIKVGNLLIDSSLRSRLDAIAQDILN